MSPLATPKFSIVNFQLSIGSHRLPDKREFDFIDSQRRQEIPAALLCLTLSFLM